MGRSTTKGSSVCVPVLKKVEERRSVQRQHQQEGAKRQKRTKKRSSRDKPNPDEVNTKIVVDSGSKEESVAQLAGQGKRRRMLVTQELVAHIVCAEVVDYMLGEPLQSEPAKTDPEFPEFDFGVSDLVMECLEENAYVLREYRTNKHTEFPTNEQAKKLVSS